MNNKIGYNNDGLVEIVRTQEFYLQFKSPRDEKVLEAMKKVDRKNFIPALIMEVCSVDTEATQKLREIFLLIYTARAKGTGLSEATTEEFIDSARLIAQTAHILYMSTKALAYNDRMISIGYKQTCSQPSIVAFMCDILELEKGHKVLEIGSGCGYHAAITSHLIGDLGHLTTIEYIKELFELAQKNLSEHFNEGLEKRINIIHSDGSIGFKEKAPYDRIYFTAGVNLKKFKPDILAEQLNQNKGILLFPEEDGDMIKQTYEKGKLANEQKAAKGICFVPLKGENS